MFDRPEARTRHDAGPSARHGRPAPAEKNSPARTRQLAIAVVALRRHVHPGNGTERVRSRSRSQIARELGSALGFSESLTAAALAVLEHRGDIAVIEEGAIYLGPGQAHPDDAEITAHIRARITADGYRPGQALPLGLIAHDCQVPVAQVRRACRSLISTRHLQSLPNGPHGRGIYVREAPSEAPEPPAAGGRRQGGKT
ncbi:hypothetical protein ACIQU4_28045 [Streptomyces sp. NPDC090741]|uniref:hypothetical protein n=1 Tax=Streptomyces sp. NPDC090741 TaxID=3365967 RepID=UPI003807B89A